MTLDLLTLPELRTWTRRAIPDADPFALAVISAASLKVLDECNNPEDWTSLNLVPAMVRMIAVQLAKRTYKNPDAIIAEGGIGPLGGDRFIEDFARTLELTAAELDTLAKVTGVDAKSEGGLWVQPLMSDQSTDSILYLRDTDGSNWMIPFLDVDLDPYYVPVD